MKLFAKDLYRALLIGFAVGGMATVVAMDETMLFSGPVIAGATQ